MSKDKKNESEIEIKEDEYIIHEVVQGDTFRILALKYYGKARRGDEIKKFNNIKSDFLFVGQKIKIPK
ncbi:hypothetical protein SDC9_152418 [bioreactor metagenome]|uniref:LysM domain-containing protein n=1 Tax=bioreactor metagenome TaxID=1076179 RepID=A0A645ET15_9ZZZZ